MPPPKKDLRNFRICRICVELLHNSRFHKDYKRLDNISTRCIDCTKAYRQHIQDEKNKTCNRAALSVVPEFTVSFN